MCILFCFFLSLFYAVYAGQIAMSIAVLAHFAAGLLFIKFVLKPVKGIVYNYYSLFFFIYGLLCILTQIELIHNPFEDFYIHNDAAWSFYKGSDPLVYDTEWSNVVSSTLLNPYFTEYPLAELFFIVIGKIGLLIGIEDLRLFWRIQNFLFASLIIATIADAIIKLDRWNEFTQRFLKLFGLCSYLYVGSCIFSRDLHIWFFYTLIAYLLVLPNIHSKFSKLVILALLSLGFRYSNGILAAFFIFVYYYKQIKEKTGPVTLFLIGVLLIGISLYCNSIIINITNKLDYYDQYVNQINQGGIFMMLYSLPFPINTTLMVIYMFFMPLPLQFYIFGTGSSFLTLPFIISPFFIIPIVILSLKYCANNLLNNNISILILCFFIGFVSITYGSPDLRRAFACVPGIFLCFCLIPNFNQWKDVKSVFINCWFVIAPISLILSLYVLFR